MDKKKNNNNNSMWIDENPTSIEVVHVDGWNSCE